MHSVITVGFSAWQRALLGEVPSLFGLPHTLGAEKSRLKAEGMKKGRE